MILRIFDKILFIITISFLGTLFLIRYVGNEYDELEKLRSELIEFIKKYSPPHKNSFDDSDIISRSLRGTKIIADSIALESAYRIGKFFLIKEDREYKLFFTGQNCPITFWFLYNKKQKKIESIKPDNFKEPVEDVIEREKYNVALAVLKNRVMTKKEMSTLTVNDRIVKAGYLDVYDENPPQWLIDSLQTVTQYKILPGIRVDGKHNQFTHCKPYYSVLNFEFANCSTGVITFGIDQHSIENEMIKINGKWRVRQFVGIGGYSWINMYKDQKNITDHFRKEKVDSLETRK